MRFADLKSVFWYPGAAAGRLDALTPEAVRDGESRLGVRLPAALIELLELQNGGAVSGECDAFPTTEAPSWSPDHVPFDSLMGIGDPGGLTILSTPALLEEWELPEGLVLLSGDGHCWVALDYRESTEPRVVWLDTELNDSALLAPDLLTFLESLTAAADFG